MSSSDRHRLLNDRLHRRGVTLAEILVVLAIFLIIASLALPTITPSLDELRLNEGSRGLTAFIQGAKARALATGRNYGIRIQPYYERFEDPLNGSMTDDFQPWVATRVSMVEQQPPYAGDFLVSKAFVAYDSSNNINVIYHLGPDLNTPDILWKVDGGSNTVGTLRLGDRIKFNGVGHEFRIVGPDSIVDNTTGFIKDPPSQQNPWQIQSVTYFDYANNRAKPLINSGTVGGWSYQIFRSPTPVARADFQLPEGVVIDMVASGGSSDVELGGQSFFFDNGQVDQRADSPIDIMFGPTGAIIDVYMYGRHQLSGDPQPVSLPIYLMLGKNEQVPTDSNDLNTMLSDPESLLNHQDFDSLWITLHPTTGRVLSSANNGVSNTGNTFLLQLFEARTFARQAQTVGGR